MIYLRKILEEDDGNSFVTLMNKIILLKCVIKRNKNVCVIFPSKCWDLF